MGLTIGEKLPEALFKTLTEDGLKAIGTDFFEGKKVLLFAVPGAFTPTCSKTHLPAYLSAEKSLKEKGIDTIACVAVNDAFVMKAWADECGVKDEIIMLSDGNAEFTKACGLELDLSAANMGTRSKRYSMLIDNSIVQKLEIDEGKTCTLSMPENMLR